MAQDSEKTIRFAHIADCHLGSWREPKMQEANMLAFQKAIQKAVDFNSDFIIIAGDLFNTSLPSIDCLKSAIKIFKNLADKKIPVYAVAGSHDYSPSGKSIFEVIEYAGLIHNLTRGTVENNKLTLKPFKDPSGVVITGILGKRGMLDKAFYEDLDRDSLETQDLHNFRIFVFHTAISEMKTKEFEKMDALPLSLLPKGFDYYAGGHVHIVKTASFPDHRKVSYPGPTFPNSFSEIEKLGSGGINLVEVKNGKPELRWDPIRTFSIKSISLDIDDISPETITAKIIEELDSEELARTLVTIRLRGILKKGSVSDIPFAEIIEHAYSRGAYFVMRNTSAVQVPELESIKIESSVSDVESQLIKNHTSQSEKLGLKLSSELISRIMDSLIIERNEAESTASFESRVLQHGKTILKDLATDAPK